jgi:hypothetical protein
MLLRYERKRRPKDWKCQGEMDARSKGEGPVRLRHIRHKMEYSRNVSQKVMVITLESDRNW